MAAEYTKNGDYKLLRIILYNPVTGAVYKLDDVMQNLAFTEDIFSPFMYGSVAFPDHNDFYQICPLVAVNDILVFRYKTAKNTREIIRAFWIYKVGLVADTASEYSHLTLYFCSAESLLNSNTKVSKSYKGASISGDIVPDLFDMIRVDADKEFTVEGTQGVHDIIIPNMNPAQAINWITACSLSAQYTGTAFLFYEDNMGFRYRSLESLYERPYKLRFAKYINNADPYNLGVKSNPEGQIQKIRIISSAVDNANAIQEGTWFTTVMAYDNVAKMKYTLEYDYVGEFGSTIHLHEHKLTPDAFLWRGEHQKYIFLPTKELRGDYDGILNYERVARMKSSLISQLSSKRYELEIFGHSDLKVGDTIEIEFPNNAVLLRPEPHRYFRGKVLVSRIDHKFTQKKYYMTIVVNDDSNADDLGPRIATQQHETQLVEL